jgi:hypothetical protein
MQKGNFKKAFTGKLKIKKSRRDDMIIKIKPHQTKPRRGDINATPSGLTNDVCNLFYNRYTPSGMASKNN